MRRGVTVAVLGLALGAALPACSTADAHAPPCASQDDSWIIIAQSVPSATYLPCIRPLPAGWFVSGSRIERGSYTLWLDSDRAGMRAVEVTLTSACNLSSAVEAPDSEAAAGVRTFERRIDTSSSFSMDRLVVFPGGCLTYAFRFQGADGTPVGEIGGSLGMRPREDVRRALARIGLRLCGAGAPDCAG